ncbi:hypothetical protein ACWD4T_38700 [Streptomyces umbrinus]
METQTTTTLWSLRIAAPGDVLIGPEEGEVWLAEGTSVCVADVGDREGNAAVGSSLGEQARGSERPHATFCDCL